jgi:hypothetical protein
VGFPVGIPVGVPVGVPVGISSKGAIVGVFVSSIGEIVGVPVVPTITSMTGPIVITVLVFEELVTEDEVPEDMDTGAVAVVVIVAVGSVDVTDTII